MRLLVRAAAVLLALLAARQAKAVPVDFLWVIDNSPSMTNKQAILASTASAIQDQLDHATCQIDWRMAVTYTDLYDLPTSNDVCPGAPGPGRRRLCPFTKDMNVFRNGTAQCAYVKAGSCGTPTEEGFSSAGVAIDRVLAGTGCEPVPGTDCHLRPDARLAVIFMTDTGEQTPHAAPAPGQPDDSVASWVRYFGDFDLASAGSQRAQVHGILCPLRPTASNPAPCGDRLADPALYDRYSNAIRLMGGTEGSIVDTDPTQLSDTIMNIVRATIAGACCGNGIVDPGEECDDGNLQDGDCCSSKCTLEPATTVCRPAAGPCDAAEFCTGASPTCPPTDTFKPSTFQCRGATGSCDVAELCTGTSADCPTDRFKPATEMCRAVAGPCDVPEHCTGAAGLCPADTFQTATTVCRPAAGVCDVAETCTGTSAACPPDARSRALCRSASGACDVAESCDGVSNDCPADRFAPATTRCRAAAGVCDVAEFCTGTSGDCPSDGLKPSTVVCRPAAGVCDLAETCTGASVDCPPDAKSTAVCRPATGACDVAESCTGHTVTCPPDAVEPSGHICRAAAGVCDVAEACDGTSADCPPDAAVPDGSPCDDGNRCTHGDLCLAGQCTAGTPKVCTGDACHDVGACDPATGACSRPAKPDGTTCDDDNACTASDVCHHERCTGTPISCDDGDACTLDSCDPARGCVNRNLDGFPGITCVCAAGLDRPACGGQRIPPRVSGHFRRACRLVQRSANARAAKRRHFLRKAAHQLKLSQQLLRRVSQRGKISATCATSLDGRLATTEAQTEHLATPR